MQKFDADRLQPRDSRDPVRDQVLRRLVPGLPGRPVRRAVRRQQLPHADDGHGPVRPGRHAGGAGRSRSRPSTCRWLLISFTSDWLFPPFQSQEMVDALIADRQAGELLQRGEPLRPRRLPAAQRIGELRRADRRLPGEPERGGGGRGFELRGAASAESAGATPPSPSRAAARTRRTGRRAFSTTRSGWTTTRSWN